jgi:hypothetical protein
VGAAPSVGPAVDTAHHVLTGGAAGAGSLAADSVRGLCVEHRCGEGVAPGMVTGNGAHCMGVDDGEAARMVARRISSTLSGLR